MSYLYFYVLRSVKGGGGIQCDNMHISTTLQPRRKNKSLMPYIHIQTHIYKKVCNIHPLTTETRLYTPPPPQHLFSCMPYTGTRSDRSLASLARDITQRRTWAQRATLADLWREFQQCGKVTPSGLDARTSMQWNGGSRNGQVKLINYSNTVCFKSLVVHLLLILHECV